MVHLYSGSINPETFFGVFDLEQGGNMIFEKSVTRIQQPIWLNIQENLNPQ
jgi:hypothetical protein